LCKHKKKKDKNMKSALITASPQEAGLLLTPLSLTIAAFAPLSGALADRIGTRWLAASGLTVACIGLVLISQLNAQSSLFAIIWRLVVIGLGQALFQSPNKAMR
jgi:MFS family permease